MKNALLVIDNKNVQVAIEDIFEQAFSSSIDYRSVATSEILGTLAVYIPDIILLVIAEEKLIDTIRVIRRQERHDDTPIVVSGETDAIEDALLDVGATAILGASFTQTELTSRIEHLLKMGV